MVMLNWETKRICGCLWVSSSRGHIRGEISTGACKDGDVDIFTSGHFSHQTAKAVVKVLREGIELSGLIESDDGDLAPGREEDLVT